MMVLHFRSCRRAKAPGAFAEERVHLLLEAKLKTLARMRTKRESDRIKRIANPVVNMKQRNPW
eukprot:1698323-Amphidinium_carterae.1